MNTLSLIESIDDFCLFSRQADVADEEEYHRLIVRIFALRSLVTKWEQEQKQRLNRVLVEMSERREALSSTPCHRQ